MPTNVIMPALELAQESGKVIRWLKTSGDAVTKGEPIVEIETDKVTVEIEAPASGILRDLTAREGDVVPVGHTIAVVFASGEVPAAAVPVSPGGLATASAPSTTGAPVKASPLARKLAEQHGVDLTQVKPSGGKIEKADVLAYVETRKSAGNGATPRLAPASPKARRL